jgi:hypothetical protein
MQAGYHFGREKEIPPWEDIGTGLREDLYLEVV